jgi:CRISPR/Cas system-associated exonuclease Cas4 (RecB family)
MRIFEHVKLPQLQFDLNAETTDSGRLYTTPEGNKYKSITTVLSNYNKQAIMEWRQSVGEEQANKISRRAADRGTKVHKICEDYLKNEIPELKMQMMMPDLKELFFKIKPHIDENVGKIYSQEQALYSDKYRIAGRVDLIAEWNGKLSVIDYKTSTKQKEEQDIQNYFMQCTAYALMFAERTGMWIDDIVVMIATEEGPSQVFERQIHDYRQPLIEYIDKYA